MAMIKRDMIVPAMLIGGALAPGSSEAMARDIALEYTTEWQTDFRGSYDWLNLLQLSADLPLGRGVSFEAKTISTAKTGGDALLDDLLTYSNIEAGDIALTFGRLGLGYSSGGAEFFAGINNVNEDYFTSEMTSFFTNSSCGISPTISCNYDIANYPLASWCLHYRQAIGPRISLQTSLYPGRGYSRLTGHDNLFSLDLKRDGIFSITSIDYKKDGINCILGVALHHGVCIGDVDAEPVETAAPQKAFTAAPWILGEIELPCELGLLVHASLSTVDVGCKAYAGAGVIYSGWRVRPGVSVNYASFTHADEYDVELTCGIPLIDERLTLQPALHIVGCGSGQHGCVGMLRLSVTL